MRLPVEKIRNAILDADRELREAAVYYFGRSYSPDPLLMPLVIQAFDQFGPEAFETFTFLDDLVQTNDSVAWLIEKVEQLNPDADEHSSNYFTGCVAALRHADARALKPHEDTIQEMRQLDDDSKGVIADRIYVSSFAPDALWRELTDFCEAQDQEDETSDEDYEFGCSIADALSCFPDQCATQVLDILKRSEEASGWLEVMAVRIAGRLKMEEAIPYFVDLLNDSDLWANDDARRALVQIGTASVVKALSSRYATAESGLRLGIAFLLEDVHSDLSVQTCLELLEQEQDPALRGPLIQSILMNFSTEGIEPARQFVLSIPKCPEVLEVRYDVLVASKIMGVAFPEFDAWTEDAKTDNEFRRQWYRDHPLVQIADAFEDEDDESSWEDEEPDGALEDGFDEESPETIVRHEEKVGRNDPCPCGSGKKYKKCCYGKEDQKTDNSHSASLGQTRPGQSSQQFPIGTVALYGPDDKITTKIVAAVIKHEGAEPVLDRFVGSNIKDSPKVRRRIHAFFDRHRVKSVAATDRNLGCPHEEGLDFPVGQDCPFCPFWAGKQGSRLGNEP